MYVLYYLVKYIPGNRRLLYRGGVLDELQGLPLVEYGLDDG